MTAPASSCPLAWCTSRERGPHTIHQNKPALIHGVTAQLVWETGHGSVRVLSNAELRADLLTTAQRERVAERIMLLADTARAANVTLGLVATGGAR